MVHYAVKCDNCEMNPICGFRFKCVECVELDVCEFCKNKKRPRPCTDKHDLIAYDVSTWFSHKSLIFFSKKGGRHFKSLHNKIGGIMEAFHISWLKHFILLTPLLTCFLFPPKTMLTENCVNGILCNYTRYEFWPKIALTEENTC